MKEIHALLATSICQTLFEAGYIAYFAGGWVRDLLLGKKSDEIDIATSAPPEIIQGLFTKTIPVGVAFGVVIVVLEGFHFEVTTFRKDHPYHDGRHPAGVDFSSPEKDALRRDFTINGMFYDPLADSIYDFVGGQEDLKKHIVRAIGDPVLRFSEDRLRMIRAVRFSSRFGFRIEEQTAAAISKQAHTLFPSVSMERIWQEFNKMAAYPNFDHALLLMKRLNLLETIFPQLKGSSIENYVKHFSYFPLGCPTIIFLIELFPTHSLEEHLELCDYLKTSNEEKKLVTFFTHSKNLFSKANSELHEWAHFYAHPYASLYLQVKAAKISPPDRLQFVNKHEKQQKKLAKHIKRIQTKTPLVNASTLMKWGIRPGKTMGYLLKEAEKAAINRNLDSAEEVLKFLPIGK